MLLGAGGAGGAGGAWWLRRSSSLSVRNLYPPAIVACLLIVLCVMLGGWAALVVLVPLGAPLVTAAAVGRRWRLSDLGAGEELRRHELERRWLWQPARALPAGERRVDRTAGRDHPRAPLARARRARVNDARRRRPGRGCRSARDATCSSAAAPAPTYAIASKLPSAAKLSAATCG
jgi:hypothetical protein